MHSRVRCSMLFICIYRVYEEMVVGRWRDREMERCQTSQPGVMLLHQLSRWWAPTSRATWRTLQQGDVKLPGEWCSVKDAKLLACDVGTCKMNFSEVFGKRWPTWR